MRAIIIKIQELRMNRTIRLACSCYENNKIDVVVNRTHFFEINRVINLSDYEIIKRIAKEADITEPINEKYRFTKHISSFLLNGGNGSYIYISETPDVSNMNYLNECSWDKPKSGQFMYKNKKNLILNLPLLIAKIKAKMAPILIEKYKKEMEEFVQFKQRQIAFLESDMESLYGLKELEK